MPTPATCCTATSSGTPVYMAPEQIEGGRLVPATDLYALGIVLYRLLTGRPPFDPKLPLHILWRRQLTEPAPPMDGVAAPVAEVVLHALEKNPAARQSDATAFALALARATAAAFGAGWIARAGLPLHLATTSSAALPRGCRPPSRRSAAPPMPPSQRPSAWRRRPSARGPRPAPAGRGPFSMTAARSGGRRAGGRAAPNPQRRCSPGFGGPTAPSIPTPSPSRRHCSGGPTRIRPARSARGRAVRPACHRASAVPAPPSDR
ncbi:hypothetical protein [Parafrankia sp. EAN1pec]|uniref:protein kinase domain-containing protein n=1 Tax=Parafrankia sp. (strain EAN1pec) TaxID=298653 RepID=UPI0000543314